MAGYGPTRVVHVRRFRGPRPATPTRRCCPLFKGWHAVEAALEFGVKVTGCTVHVATPAVDDGPILAQAAVPVLPDDTVESLHERIKTVERRLYIQTIEEILARGSVL